MTDLGTGSWPARRARITPGATAFTQAETSYTYRQLADRVDALAAALAELGVWQGDRVAYLGANDIATFETFFAVGRLGAIFVPLNTRLTAPEVGYLLDDSGAEILLYGTEMADLIAALQLQSRGVQTAVLVGGAASDDQSSAADSPIRYTDLLARGRTLPAIHPEVSLEDDALILYTSGTTGRPKGAVLTHSNIFFNTVNQLAHIDVLSTDTVLCTAPLFHVTGLGQVSLPTLFKGGTVVIAPRFDAGWMLEAIPTLGITAFSGVPTMLQMLCDHDDFTAADLSTLRYVVYGGSPIVQRVARTWLDRGVIVLQGYGMTEAAAGVRMATPTEAVERPSSAGVEHFFTDSALLQPDGQIIVGAGTGELVVRGPNIFHGYWHRSGTRDEYFTRGWFRSGDIARVDDDGWAYIVDRVKDMIISGGENIYPAEVEAAINAIPEIAESAVIAVPDGRWGEVGRAFVVLNPGHHLTFQHLRESLTGTLARYKIPTYIEFVPELPRTATGKLRKQDLDNSVPATHPIKEHQ